MSVPWLAFQRRVDAMYAFMCLGLGPPAVLACVYYIIFCWILWKFYVYVCVYVYVSVYVYVNVNVKCIVKCTCKCTPTFKCICKCKCISTCRCMCINIFDWQGKWKGAVESSEISGSG